VAPIRSSLDKFGHEYERMIKVGRSAAA
jgi:hypothetical protein